MITSTLLISMKKIKWVFFWKKLKKYIFLYVTVWKFSSNKPNRSYEQSFCLKIIKSKISIEMKQVALITEKFYLLQLDYKSTNKN